MLILSKVVVFVFIFMNLAIPGGDLLGINIKMISLVLLVFLLVFLQYRRDLIVINNALLFSGALFIWVLVSAAVALFYEVDSYYIFMELRVIVPVFVITFLFWVLYAWKQDLNRFLVLSVAISLVFFAAYKVLLEGMLVAGVLDIESLLRISEYIGGEVPVYSPMPFDMVRIFWTKPDLILSLSPVLILLMFPAVGLSRWVWPSIVLISLAVVIGYSRALMAVFMLFLILGVLIRYGVIRSVLFLLPIIIILSIPLFSYVVELYEIRVSEQYTGKGDETRWIQMHSLIDGWKEHFIFGSGIGSHAILVRDPELPFVYEMWLLSFFMKTGLIGLALFLLMLLTLNLNILKNWHGAYKRDGSGQIVKVMFFVINITVLLSFSNQYLPSTVTATFLGVLIYLYRSHQMDNKTIKVH